MNGKLPHIALVGDAIAQPLNFTNNKAIRHNFAAAAKEVLSHVADALAAEKRTFPIDAQILLVQKMAHTLCKRGQNYNEIARLNNEKQTIAALCVHTDIKAHPQQSLHKLLQGFDQAQALLRRREWEAHILKIGEVPTVLANIGPQQNHMLVELSTIEHLQQESAMLGHCIGTKFDKAALKAAGLIEDLPQAAQYLSYAIKLRHRELRIFSVRDVTGRSYATIAYTVLQNAITEIGGRERKISACVLDEILYQNEPKPTFGSIFHQEDQINSCRVTGFEPFFPVLCDAVWQLTQQLPVREIQQLPPIRTDYPTMLTRYGALQTIKLDSDVSVAIKTVGWTQPQPMRPKHLAPAMS
jgi:hypothetical protein